jgi:hypothetical protein
MTTEQSENLEIALLAGMVKGNMKQIDSLMTERSDIPADRIDLHKFVNTVRNNMPQRNNVDHQPEQVNHIQVNHSPVHHAPVQTIQENNFVIDNKVKDDIECIKITMEKINNNLTKLCGMFGKVFQNMVKDNKK